MAAKVKSQSNGHSFIKTGGEWVPPVAGTSVCAEIPGHYVGGTREPGRFTSALAPMPQNRFLAERGALKVPPPPDYSTPRAITLRAREAGATSMTDWLPLAGEELGVKFLRRMVLVNKLYKKRDAAGLTALGLDLDRLTAQLAEGGAYWGKAPHLPYEMSNLSGRIGADRKRIEAIRARQNRAAKADAAPGGVLIEGEAWVRVTFAEKPERSIIDALKAAGFRWGGGSWIGERAKVPAEVTA